MRQNSSKGSGSATTSSQKKQTSMSYYTEPKYVDNTGLSWKEYKPGWLTPLRRDGTPYLHEGSHIQKHRLDGAIKLTHPGHLTIEEDDEI